VSGGVTERLQSRVARLLGLVVVEPDSDPRPAAFRTAPTMGSASAPQQSEVVDDEGRLWPSREWTCASGASAGHVRPDRLVAVRGGNRGD
jgi:hypothetical protein